MSLVRNALISAYNSGIWKIKRQRSYKVSGVGCLLVSYVNVHQWDNEKLRAINKHWKTKYEMREPKSI